MISTSGTEILKSYLGNAGRRQKPGSIWQCLVGRDLLKAAQGHQRNLDLVFCAESYYPTWTLEIADEALTRKISSIAECRTSLLPPGHESS